jgi:hypothetical protein
VCNIFEFDRVLRENAHHLDSLFGVLEIVNNCWQITKGNILLIIELVAHNQCKFGPLVEFLFWLEILRVLQLCSHLVHSLRMRLHKVQQELLFLLTFNLLLHCLFSQKLLLTLQSVEESFSFSLVDM